MIPHEVMAFFDSQDEQLELLFFADELSISNLSNVIDQTEKKLQEQAVSVGVRKAVVHVLLECLQNALKHGLTIEGINEIRCSVCLTKAAVEIKVGNLVAPKKCAELKKWIDELNNLDEHSLRETYRERLTERFDSSYYVNGLGLMDIIRKSGDRLDYHFFNLTEESHFFVLRIKLPLPT